MRPIKHKRAPKPLNENEGAGVCPRQAQFPSEGQIPNPPLWGQTLVPPHYLRVSGSFSSGCRAPFPPGVRLLFLRVSGSFSVMVAGSFSVMVAGFCVFGPYRSCNSGRERPHLVPGSAAFPHLVPGSAAFPCLRRVLKTKEFS